MPTPEDARKVYAKIDEIAASLGAGKPWLVFHRPEDWAIPSRRFENAAEKIRRVVGRVAYLSKSYLFGIRFRTGFSFFRKIFLTSLIFVNSFGSLFINARISLESCSSRIACRLSFSRSAGLRFFTSSSLNAPTLIPMATISFSQWRLNLRKR
jgi:hypothetical protein